MFLKGSTAILLLVDAVGSPPRRPLRHAKIPSAPASAVPPVASSIVRRVRRAGGGEPGACRLLRRAAVSVGLPTTASTPRTIVAICAALASPRQPSRSTARYCLNPRGGIVPSSETGTSLRMSRPCEASSSTQSDDTETFDQATITASQRARATSTDFAKTAPPSISVSHQTLMPACSSASASTANPVLVRV